MTSNIFSVSSVSTLNLGVLTGTRLGFLEWVLPMRVFAEPTLFAAPGVLFASIIYYATSYFNYLLPSSPLFFNARKDGWPCYSGSTAVILWSPTETSATSIGCSIFFGECYCVLWIKLVVPFRFLAPICWVCPFDALCAEAMTWLRLTSPSSFYYIKLKCFTSCYGCSV